VVERNMGQALSAGGLFDPLSLASTLDPESLWHFEQLAGRIEAPEWPERLFGAIDQRAAAAGRAVYLRECVSCHVDPPATGSVPDRVIPVSAIATDAARVRVSQVTLGARLYPESVGVFLANIKKKAYVDRGIPEARQREMEAGHHPAIWRATGGYAARSLAGIWARAPYLHNGSVPTLADLLQPATDRPVTFTVGGREFDPAKVGFAPGRNGKWPAFLFDTRLAGNRNTGHEYGTAMSAEQKRVLLEYLKTR
jgi:hypothetical protein